jgi:hypothetical protein
VLSLLSLASDHSTFSLRLGNGTAGTTRNRLYRRNEVSWNINRKLQDISQTTLWKRLLLLLPLVQNDRKHVNVILGLAPVAMHVHHHHDESLLDCYGSRLMEVVGI